MDAQKSYRRTRERQWRRIMKDSNSRPSAKAKSARTRRKEEFEAVGTQTSWSRYTKRQFFNLMTGEQLSETVDDARSTKEGTLVPPRLIRRELIVDEEPHKRRFGDCVHAVDEFSHVATGVEFHGESEINLDLGGHPLKRCDEFRLKPDISDVPDVLTDPVSLTRELWELSSLRARLQSQALESWRPDIRDGYSPWILGIEGRPDKIARSMISLAKNVRNLLDQISISSLRKLNRKLGRRYSVEVKVVETATSAHLAQTFGMLPFIRGVVQTFEKFLNLQNEVEKFLNAEGKPLTLHFQKNLPPGLIDPLLDGEGAKRHTFLMHVVPKYSIDRANLCESIEIPIERLIKVTNVKYNATARGILDLGPGTKAMKRSRLIMEGWGLMPRPSDVWEVIPLSFVIDWFLGVESFIRKNWDRPVIQPIYRLYEFCDTIRFDTTQSVTQTWLEPMRVRHSVKDGGAFYGRSWSVNPSLALGSSSHRRYYRLRGQPRTSEHSPNIGFSIPNKKETSLMFSLIAQRWIAGL